MLNSNSVDETEFFILIEVQVMGLFSTMIQLQLQLFLLMAVGYFCKYIGILNDESKKSLSDLLIYVILPCNIISSFTSGIEVSS